MDPAMNDESKAAEDKRLAETEVRHEFVSRVAADDGEPGGHLIGSLTEKKVYHRPDDDGDVRHGGSAAAGDPGHRSETFAATFGAADEADLYSARDRRRDFGVAG